MLSEQFNRPVDGTTNFDSPSGISSKYSLIFSIMTVVSQIWSYHSGQSHRAAEDNSMNWSNYL